MTDPIRVVVRVRTLVPTGLNPTQRTVINHLQTLARSESIAELDVDVWGSSVETARNDQGCGPRTTHGRVAEFERWAMEQGYTLQPAFRWRTTDSTTGNNGKRRHREVLTPLIGLAVYSMEEDLKAVYPHVDNGDVRTIHDGIEAIAAICNSERSSIDERRSRSNPVP